MTPTKPSDKANLGLLLGVPEVYVIGRFMKPLGSVLANSACPAFLRAVLTIFAVLTSVARVGARAGSRC